MFVKICGLKTPEQVEQAVTLGCDAVGFVMHKSSKRYVDAQRVRELSIACGGRAKVFVVGITYDEVAGAAEHADYVQVHEAVKIPNLVYSSAEPPAGVDCAMFIYDKSIGSGTYSDFPAWLDQYRHKLLLCGGLNPDNVAEAVRQIRPFGVDVSSGIEKDDVKDYELMKKFIDAAKGEAR
jgi:phosphoribosylanthranilate isomerase